MRRLFSVGCSFTRYHWPTYVDIIGKEFNEFQNWGNSGLGNRAILERLTELVVENDITKDDVIIVQWSAIHRFDMHIPHRFPLDGWFTGGNLLNNPTFNEEWKNFYWNESSYVMHTLHFITLATKLLESLPCTWYMTSMNDLLDELDDNRFIAFDRYREYLNTENWLPPLQEYFQKNNFEQKILNKPIRDHLGQIIDYKKYKDPHPSPLVHYFYAKEFLADRLNITLDYNWAKTADDLISNASVHEDIRPLLIEHLKWDNNANWMRGL